jgi:transposase
MAVKYTVNLSELEIKQLQEITSKGKTAARKLKRAQILLLADEGHRDEKIAQMLKVGESTVHRIRQRCVEEGVELALKERPRPGSSQKLNGKSEAFLIATACSDAPEGRESWTMQLLADRLVELKLVESISDETVRRTLKKTKLSLG